MQFDAIVFVILVIISAVHAALGLLLMLGFAAAVWFIGREMWKHRGE